MIKKEYTLALLSICLFFSSCSVIGGIFKAGMWWGIFLVVGFIALLLFLLSRGRK
jgi:hypothetical protein